MQADKNSVHKRSSYTSSWKTYLTKTSNIAFLSTTVDSYTWIVYHSDSLILTNNYASTSSAISSTHRMVFVIRETFVTFLTAASQKSLQQISLAASKNQLFANSKELFGFNNVVKLVFSVLTNLLKWWASIIGSDFHVHVFALSLSLSLCLPKKTTKTKTKKNKKTRNSKDLSFNAGCLVSMSWSSFEVFVRFLC